MPTSSFPSTRCYLAAAVGLLLAATPDSLPAQAVDLPQADLTRAAAAHYQAYGRALSNGWRDQIASFYDPECTLVILNGSPGETSREALDARFRGPWRPPAYFQWDTLAFRPLGPQHVLVTGGFRWQSTGQADTVHYQYTAVLVAIDSGPAITFEQETRWPSP